MYLNIYTHTVYTIEVMTFLDKTVKTLVSLNFDIKGLVFLIYVQRLEMLICKFENKLSLGLK